MNHEMAAVDFDDFLRLLTRWTVDIYHNEYNRMTRSSPLDLWTQGAVAMPVPKAFTDEEICLYCSLSATRALRRTGVEFMALRYNSSALGDLRRKLDVDLDVQVRYDSDDLGSVLVMDPVSGSAMRVPCTDQEYARGLSVYQHQCIQRYAISEYKEKHGAALRLAKVALFADIDESETRHRKLSRNEVRLRKTRQKADTGTALGDVGAPSAPAKTPEEEIPESNLYDAGAQWLEEGNA